MLCLCGGTNLKSVNQAINYSVCEEVKSSRHIKHDLPSQGHRKLVRDWCRRSKDVKSYLCGSLADATICKWWVLYDVILLQQNRNRAWWTQSISSSDCSVSDSIEQNLLWKVKMCQLSSGNWLFCTKFVQLAVAGLIGPGGLLLVVPTYMQFHLQFYWWGCPKKQLKLRHLIFLIQCDIVSTCGDALTTITQYKTLKKIPCGPHSKDPT
jgi:hypothetical protein